MRLAYETLSGLYGTGLLALYANDHLPPSALQALYEA